MNEIKFIHIKEKLKKISLKIIELTEEKRFIERIKFSSERLENENMNVLIVGEFSRGKSTFINALIGKPVLPAKVNPTTATINVISGSDRNDMVIDYYEGESKTLSLPDEKINKFLMDFVTVSNEECQKIKKVNLNIGGKLQEWDCVLVDTPGVNDLDSTREEITFKYLSQADACIVLLDSQQPLSESERRFLNDKILANDINRVVFVINKIDESDDVPDGSCAERLKEYVRKLINECVPQIKEPQVYAVSSKKALKARFKGEDSAWEESFSRFEKELFNIISKNASNGKLPEHILRLKNIVNDIIHYYKEELFNMDKSHGKLAEERDKLINEKKMLGLKCSEINILIDKQKNELKNNILKVAREEFTSLKAELLNEAKELDNMENVIMLKSHMSRKITAVIENIYRIIEENKKIYIEKFYEKINEVYLESGSKEISIYKENDIDLHNNGSFELTFERNDKLREEDKMSIVKTIATGGAIGYLAGALLGPVGIVAGVIGSGILGMKVGEKIEQEKVNRIINDIDRQLSEVIHNAETKSYEIAEAEMNHLSSEFNAVINEKIQVIDMNYDSKEKALLDKNCDLNNKKIALDNKINELSKILNEVIEIDEEL